MDRTNLSELARSDTQELLPVDISRLDALLDSIGLGQKQKP